MYSLSSDLNQILADFTSEERLTALRKRAELDSKTFNFIDRDNLNESAKK